MVAAVAANRTGSARSICAPAPRPPPTQNTHDGKWTSFRLELLPPIREGIAVARGQRFLPRVGDPNRLRPAGMNVGWEAPGSYDVKIELQGLSLTAVPY